MSTRAVQDHTKHPRRFLRLALAVSVVFGLTCAVQSPNALDLLPWSAAHAEALATTASVRKVQPRVVDFAKLAKQKAEARGLLETARRAAANGDIEIARRLADQAATIPVEWNLGEVTPKKFLDGLESDPSRFASLDRDNVGRLRSDAGEQRSRQRTIETSETLQPTHSPLRNVIDLSFPENRVAADDNAEDMSLTEEPRAVRLNASTTPRSSSSDAPRTLQSMGFKTSDSAVATTETAEEPLRASRRYAPIPSLEELAGTTAGESTTRPKAKQSALRIVSPPPTVLPTSDATHPSSDLLASAQSVQGAVANETRIDRSTASAEPLIAPERFDADSSEKPAKRSTSTVHDEQVARTATAAIPETVIHEIRVVDRASPVTQADMYSASSTQFLMNINSLMIVGVFGALLLLIVVAATVLKRFGPNPQFTFKVEVSNPSGAAAISNPVAPLISSIVPFTQNIAPIASMFARPEPAAAVIARERLSETGTEHQHEDAMMRQVLEDNLQLRQQLDDSRVAA